MKCLPDIAADKEFFWQFGIKAERERIPLFGGIEITRQCNLSCVHCYLGDTKRDKSCIRQELDTRTWKRIIDEITDAGCLFLLFTGGEPMLREDFADIYRHAKTRGLIVTVFTNGTRISDEILRTFTEFPPQKVEITLYGATEKTYQSVTRRSGEFQKCMTNLDKLISNKIPVELKTMLMTTNRDELSAIERIADERGLKFRFDAAIFPALDGDRLPLQFRVQPEEAAAQELSSARRLKEWNEYAYRKGDVLPLDCLYDCSAGLTNFHIGPDGNLQPCVMTSHIYYNLRNGCFNKGWRDVIPKIRDLKPDARLKCTDCQKRMFCGFCPAFFRLETGSENLVSEYICRVGHIMEKKIMEYQKNN